jgi:hypothetical protein
LAFTRLGNTGGRFKASLRSGETSTVASRFALCCGAAS